MEVNECWEVSRASHSKMGESISGGEGMEGEGSAVVGPKRRINIYPTGYCPYPYVYTSKQHFKVIYRYSLLSILVPSSL